MRSKNGINIFEAGNPCGGKVTWMRVGSSAVEGGNNCSTAYTRKVVLCRNQRENGRCIGC